MAFWIALIFAFDEPYLAVLTILAALIHELGHLLVIMLLKSKTQMPIGRLFGFKIKENRLFSHKSEIMILGAGAAANILAAALLLPLAKLLGNYIITFIYVNLATALSNLLPTDGYDGYGILSELFDYYGLPPRILDAVSFTVTVLLSFLSLYLIGKFGQGYWLFAIFFISVVSKLKQRLEYGIF